MGDGIGHMECGKAAPILARRGWAEGGQERTLRADKIEPHERLMPR